MSWKIPLCTRTSLTFYPAQTAGDRISFYQKRQDARRTSLYSGLNPEPSQEKYFTEMGISILLFMGSREFRSLWDKVEHTCIPMARMGQVTTHPPASPKSLSKDALCSTLYLYTSPLRLHVIQALFINYVGSDQAPTRRKKLHRMTLTPVASTSTSSGRASPASIQLPLPIPENVYKSQTILCLVLPLGP